MPVLEDFHGDLSKWAHAYWDWTDSDSDEEDWRTTDHRTFGRRKGLKRRRNEERRRKRKREHTRPDSPRSHESTNQIKHEHRSSFGVGVNVTYRTCSGVSFHGRIVAVTHDAFTVLKASSRLLSDTLTIPMRHASRLSLWGHHHTPTTRPMEQPRLSRLCKEHGVSIETDPVLGGWCLMTTEHLDAGSCILYSRLNANIMLFPIEGGEYNTTIQVSDDLALHVHGSDPDLRCPGMFAQDCTVQVHPDGTVTRTGKEENAEIYFWQPRDMYLEEWLLGLNDGSEAGLYLRLLKPVPARSQVFVRYGDSFWGLT